jgi:hypothetical protein
MIWKIYVNTTNSTNNGCVVSGCEYRASLPWQAALYWHSYIAHLAGQSSLAEGVLPTNKARRPDTDWRVSIASITDTNDLTMHVHHPYVCAKLR